MFNRLLGIASCLVVIAACGTTPAEPTTPAGPTSAASQAPPAAGVLAAQSSPQPMAGGLPFKASAVWTAAPPQWAGNPAAPGYAPSLFGGRCSVPSDYVISATFEGHATHAGRVTGSGSHCSQLVWGSGGAVMGATYSDGQGVIVTANGSTILLRYGNGTTGADAATGDLWFRDEWTIIGGTGLFTGAAGSGIEGGSFASFGAIMAGAPVQMWMEGTINYSPNAR